jgi:hypothetical protein
VLSASYFRRQAETCLRLSRSVDGEMALRLAALAEDYLEKAEAAERERKFPPYLSVVVNAARQTRTESSAGARAPAGPKASRPNVANTAARLRPNRTAEAEQDRARRPVRPR